MIDIKPEYLEIIKKILKKYISDCEVWAFGSRVTGTLKKYSDLDLAIIGNKKLSLKTLALLQEEFEESDLPFRVDFLDWNTISPEFQAIIKKSYFVVQKVQI